MSQYAKEITKTTVERELKKSYLDYAMSVIIGRALPDVRDGLKPVHRRVLFAMSVLRNDWNKPYKKSARIVGDVIGKYHPHGDMPVYDAIVRMAQPFSMRYRLVDGQGNFGSIDGDMPAAMRYTEIRLSRFAHALLEDLDKETVDFLPNYDETELIPAVMPTRIPNLLVNGSSGIAVGMATNIPPHNLGEVVDACIALIDDPTIDVDELMSYLPGPDFPTAGFINGRAGIIQAYRTGRGKIYVRAKTAIETDQRSDKQSIIVTELPYQVNKARLISKIAELAKNKKVEGITAIRDESDRQGMRVVIEVRVGDNADVVLNNLFSSTQLQCVFGINMVALTDMGRPSLMNLKDMLDAFIRHRREVVVRRTQYDLRKARLRAHILEGLGVALANIDAMIVLIKAASDPSNAKQGLLNRTWPPKLVVDLLENADSNLSRPDLLNESYGLVSSEAYQLSPTQAQAILDLKLHRLTGLEQKKIVEEYKSILIKIRELLKILQDPDHLMAIIREELSDIRATFNDKRRTEILDTRLDFDDEDLIAEEDIVVTFSKQGYVKSQALDSYQAQHRGGRGKTAARTKEEDHVCHLLLASTHDTILCFSSLGRVYWLKGYQIPQVGRTAMGKPIVNFLPLALNERISAVLKLRDYNPNQFLVMATERGFIKKVSLTQFSKPRSSGVIAIDLIANDHLVGVKITEGHNDILLFTDAGKVIRFKETNVRAMGRMARGVRGIRLKGDQKVIALIVPQSEDTSLLITSARGYGKRTSLVAFRCILRGGQGVIAMQVNHRNGPIIDVVQVSEGDEVLLISDAGTLVRTRIDEIPVLGRNTQGVRLIHLNNDEHLVGLQCVELDVQQDKEVEAS